MIRIISGLGIALSLMASPAFAQSVTYYVEAAPYSSLSNMTACPVGSCATYANTHKVSGHITLSGAPPANEVDYDVNLGISSFSISDGPNTYTDADLYNTVYINTAKVSTNASGEIINFEFKFDRVNTPNSYPIQDSTLAAARVSSIWFSSVGAIRVSADTNAICMLRGDNASDGSSPTGATLGAGCKQWSGTPANGRSTADSNSVSLSLTPPPTPTPVPTLSEWAMILFGILLAGATALSLNRRQFQT